MGVVREAIVVVVTASATLLVASSPAAADAQAGANNCAGAFVSALTPAFTTTDPPSFGRSRSELAKTGVVGEMEKAATEALASCGHP